MTRSRRLLAAGFAAALGIAGVTIGSGSLSASTGGGICEGIDLGAIAGTAPAGTDAAGTAPAGTEPAGTEPAGTEPAGTEPAGTGGRGWRRCDRRLDVRRHRSWRQVVQRRRRRRARPCRRRLRHRPDRVAAPGRRRPRRARRGRCRRRQPAGDRHRVPVDRHDHPGVRGVSRHALPAHRRRRRGSTTWHNIVFAEEQGSFLVGVAAALQSESGQLGFVGGVPNDLIKKFEAGFMAGAQCVNPDAEVLVEYISDDPTDRLQRPCPGQGDRRGDVRGRGRRRLRRRRANRHQASSRRPPRPASRARCGPIGVDSDLYQQVDADLQPYVLTSMLKRVDIAVYNTIEQRGQRRVRPWRRDLRPQRRRRRLLDVGRLHRRLRPDDRRRWRR